MLALFPNARSQAKARSHSRSATWMVGTQSLDLAGLHQQEAGDRSWSRTSDPGIPLWDMGHATGILTSDAFLRDLHTRKFHVTMEAGKGGVCGGWLKPPTGFLHYRLEAQFLLSPGNPVFPLLVCVFHF